MPVIISLPARSIAAALPGAISALQTALQPLSTLYGITTLDPFSSPYQMNNQGLDGMFDDVSVAFSNGTMTFTQQEHRRSFLQRPARQPGKRRPAIRVPAGADGSTPCRETPG